MQMVTLSFKHIMILVLQVLNFQSKVVQQDMHYQV